MAAKLPKMATKLPKMAINDLKLTKMAINGQFQCFKEVYSQMHFFTKLNMCTLNSYVPKMATQLPKIAMKMT